MQLGAAACLLNLQAARVRFVGICLDRIKLHALVDWALAVGVRRPVGRGGACVA